MKRETEICDKIREASDEFDRLIKAGKDTAEALRQLEAALAELWQLKDKTFRMGSGLTYFKIDIYAMLVHNFGEISKYMRFKQCVYYVCHSSAYTCINCTVNTSMVSSCCSEISSPGYICSSSLFCYSSNN